MIFLFFYGALNAYAFIKLSRLLHRHRARILLAIVIALLAFGAQGVELFNHLGWPGAERAMGLASYCWMAAILWFVLFAGCMDAWNFFLHVMRHRRPAARRWIIPFRPGMKVVGVLVALMLVYGLIEAQWLRLEEFRLHSPRFHGPPLRILQISDVHLGLIEREHRLNQILRIIERTNPDLIIASGDLLDGSGEHVRYLAPRLAAVQPRLGKVAIFGNHEFYNGVRKSLAFFKTAGFRVLRDEALDVDGGRLRLVGLDDPTGVLTGVTEIEPDEPALLGPARADRFTLLLKHQPIVDPASLGRFDLMLSGHTHRGQILPFGLFAWLEYRYFSGVYHLPQGSVLRVSRGTGTWGPPMCVGSQPEVTLITLEPAE